MQPTEICTALFGFLPNVSINRVCLFLAESVTPACVMTLLLYPHGDPT